jgi:hypothetical protein
MGGVHDVCAPVRGACGCLVTWTPCGCPWVSPPVVNVFQNWVNPPSLPPSVVGPPPPPLCVVAFPLRCQPLLGQCFFHNIAHSSVATVEFRVLQAKAGTPTGVSVNVRSAVPGTRAWACSPGVHARPSSSSRCLRTRVQQARLCAGAWGVCVGWGGGGWLVGPTVVCGTRQASGGCALVVATPRLSDAACPLHPAGFPTQW